MSPRASRKRPKKAAAEPKTPPNKGRKLTKPSTPAMLRRASTSKKTKVMSTEEREMVEIAEKKKEMVKRRRLSRESFKRLSQGGHYIPKPSEKPRTVPKSPDFKSKHLEASQPKTTRTRFGANAPTRKPDMLPSNPGLKGMVLRSTGSKSKFVPTSTKPVPFKGKAAQMAAKVPKTKKSTFQNMVQKVRKFAGGTPDRYHTRSKKYDKFVPSGKPAAQPSLTKPEAPELMTEGALYVDIYLSVYLSIYQYCPAWHLGSFEVPGLGLNEWG